MSIVFQQGNVIFIQRDNLLLLILIISLLTLAPYIDVQYDDDEDDGDLQSSRGIDNGPGSMTTTAAANNNNNSTDIPAVDLVSIEGEIQRLIARKIQVEQYQLELEGRIYGAETEYFRQTAQFGSLLTGLHGYLGIGNSTNSTTPHHTPSHRRAISTTSDLRPEDRIFSNTSNISRRIIRTASVHSAPSSMSSSHRQRQTSSSSSSTRLRASNTIVAEDGKTDDDEEEEEEGESDSDRLKAHDEPYHERRRQQQSGGTPSTTSTKRSRDHHRNKRPLGPKRNR